MRYSIEGADECAKFFEQYVKELPKRVRAFEKALADIGYDQFKVSYADPFYAGSNDIEVSFKEDTKGYEVKASGTTVLFVEFGTGVYYSQDNPYASVYGFERGGYGNHQGLNQTWVYRGEKGNRGWTPKGETRTDVVATHGNESANAIYKAEERISADIEKIAREVFGNA